MRSNKLQLTIYIFLTIIFFGSIYLKASDSQISAEQKEKPNSSVAATNL